MQTPFPALQRRAGRPDNRAPSSMSISKKELPSVANAPDDLTPEAILARATKARGDIFPEWKPVAQARPKTYHLVNETVSYLHQYHGQTEDADRLSAPMSELIA